MYIDNKEFLDIYANIILNKKNNQIFSADISSLSLSLFFWGNKTFKNTNVKKYLPFFDFLIFSTKELNSILEGSNYKKL